MIMNNINKHNNGSADHHSDNENNSNPETIIIINCVLNAPLILISILSNALVLAAIIKTPSIRSTPHMIMLCSLAVSDLLVGLIAQPIFVAHQLTGDHYVSQVFSDDGVLFMYSFSHDNNSHHCGSISGSSLSHEICYFSD